MVETTAQRDRIRDRWLRDHGWLVLRVDAGVHKQVGPQVRRVVEVVRALTRAR